MELKNHPSEKETHLNHTSILGLKPLNFHDVKRFVLCQKSCWIDAKKFFLPVETQTAFAITAGTAAALEGGIDETISVLLPIGSIFMVW